MFENSIAQVKEAMPKTEVVAKAKRRRFTAAEKQRLLREVDACQGSGEVGALLRREGIYASYLTTWRKQRASGELDGLATEAQSGSTRTGQAAPRARPLAGTPAAGGSLKSKKKSPRCWSNSKPSGTSRVDCVRRTISGNGRRVAGLPGFGAAAQRSLSQSPASQAQSRARTCDLPARTRPQ